MEKEEEINILTNKKAKKRTQKKGKFDKFDYLRKTSDGNKRFIRYGIRIYQTVNVYLYLTVTNYRKITRFSLLRIKILFTIGQVCS